MNIKIQLLLDSAHSYFKSEHKFAKGINLLRYFLLQRIDSPSSLAYQLQFPVQAIILSTTRCNLSCPDCFYRNHIRDNGDNGLRTDFDLDSIKLLYHSPLFKTICRVALVGGEPLLNRNIPDMVRFLKGKGLIVTVTTNGFLVTKEWLIKLREAGLNWLSITIYEHNREQLRKVFLMLPGTGFDKRRISLVFHGSEISKYEEAYQFARSIKASHLTFNHLYLENELRGDVERDRFADAFDHLCLRIRQENQVTLYAFPPYRSSNRGPVRCSALGMITISPALELAPCCHLFPHGKFGSVADSQKLVNFKRELFCGAIPAMCQKCYMLRASVY